MIEPVKVATSLSAKLWKNEHSDATEMNKYALPSPSQQLLRLNNPSQCKTRSEERRVGKEC